MRVAIVTEYYPRAHDPVLGIWAHRQAVAARDAGADVRVLVLYRPVPPLSTAARDVARETRRLLRHPRRATLDGIEVEYVRFASPPRPRAYGSWGAWSAPAAALALRRLRGRFVFDLVHAHNAVPAGDAVRRAR
ncbi:MAG TPA: glycosyltransferase family 4 protein, partial [Solirubrobacteraceae bacterium]|nr:glycosyltransferase family 4 protein [Solirubrobacteraceae bacterium]